MDWIDGILLLGFVGLCIDRIRLEGRLVWHHLGLCEKCGGPETDRDSKE